MTALLTDIIVDEKVPEDVQLYKSQKWKYAINYQCCDEKKTCPQSSKSENKANAKT